AHLEPTPEASKYAIAPSTHPPSPSHSRSRYAKPAFGESSLRYTIPDRGPRRRRPRRLQSFHPPSGTSALVRVRLTRGTFNPRLRSTTVCASVRSGCSQREKVALKRRPPAPGPRDQRNACHPGPGSQTESSRLAACQSRPPKAAWRRPFQAVGPGLASCVRAGLAVTEVMLGAGTAGRPAHDGDVQDRDRR